MEEELEIVAASPAAQAEALELSEVLLKNIELGEISLASIFLKAARLARLLNDFEMQTIFRYEVSGYPSNPDGVPPEIFGLATKAGRRTATKDGKTNQVVYKITTQGVGATEEFHRAAKLQLSNAADSAISISSANPNQYVGGLVPKFGNAEERDRLRTMISNRAEFLEGRRAFVYGYVLERHYDLKLSGIARDVFAAIRQRADQLIAERVPGAAQKVVSVLENLQSENPEDWANAVHSCRRLLQDVADAVFPPGPSRKRTQNGKEIEIKLGPDNYINRLVAYAEDNSNSERFKQLVGSHLGLLGDRLDAIFAAAQKGSHASVAREEAERYVIYTYMVVSDLLGLGPAIRAVGPAGNAPV